MDKVDLLSGIFEDEVIKYNPKYLEDITDNVAKLASLKMIKPHVNEAEIYQHGDIWTWVGKILVRHTDAEAKLFTSSQGRAALLKFLYSDVLKDDVFEYDCYVRIIDQCESFGQDWGNGNGFVKDCWTKSLTNQMKQEARMMLEVTTSQLKPIIEVDYTMKGFEYFYSYYSMMHQFNPDPSYHPDWTYFQKLERQYQHRCKDWEGSMKVDKPLREVKT